MPLSGRQRDEVTSGLMASEREWAMRQGWGGRPVRLEQAQGILIAGLGMLAGHFGYERAA